MTTFVDQLSVPLVAILGNFWYDNLLAMSTNKWATSKLSAKVWVKLLFLLENVLKLNLEAL